MAVYGVLVPTEMIPVMESMMIPVMLFGEIEYVRDPVPLVDVAVVESARPAVVVIFPTEIASAVFTIIVIGQ